MPAGDTTPPTVTRPLSSLQRGLIARPFTVPVRIAWTAHDETAGTVTSQLQIARLPGTFQDVAVPAGATATTVFLVPGFPYVARVRATDAVGNQSAWSARHGFTLRRGGRPPGRGVTIRARSIAVIADTGPSEGIVRVDIDALSVRVSLHAFGTAHTRFAFAKTYARVASRLLKLSVAQQPAHNLGIAWLT